MQAANDALQVYQKPEPVQVAILFKAIGNAPIMKQNLYKINAQNQFRAVIRFLRKQLGYNPQDALFTYINLSFAPAPDDTVLNLHKHDRGMGLTGRDVYQLCLQCAAGMYMCPLIWLSSATLRASDLSCGQILSDYDNSEHIRHDPSSVLKLR